MSPPVHLDMPGRGLSHSIPRFTPEICAAPVPGPYQVWDFRLSCDWLASFSLASHIWVSDTTRVSGSISSLNAASLLNQSVPSLRISYDGCTANDRVLMRDPVSASVPDGDAPELTALKMRRIASVMSAGVLALMNSPRVLVAACQISSTVLRSSF